MRSVLIYAFCFGLLLPSVAAQACLPTVLVFSKTSGFRHGNQITAGISMFQGIAATAGVSLELSEDANDFNVQNLARFSAVVFLNTTGNIFNAAQESAFESYINAGGAFLGIHSATDTEAGWPFYVDLVGASFQNHPSIQSATLNVVNSAHPSTSHYAPQFVKNDEWYNFQTNPANNPAINVLITIDESTYSGGNMGSPHPISWCRAFPSGARSWYTAMGHTVSTYTDSDFIQHVLGGLIWVTSKPRILNLLSATSYTGGATPGMSLTATQPAPAVFRLTVAGAPAGANGLLGVSLCDDLQGMSPLVALISLDPSAVPLLIPMIFNAAGGYSLDIPQTLALSGMVSDRLFVQFAALGTTPSVSNGLSIQLGL